MSTTIVWTHGKPAILCVSMCVVISVHGGNLRHLGVKLQVMFLKKDHGLGFHTCLKVVFLAAYVQNPSIRFLHHLLIAGRLEPIPATMEREAGYTRDRSQWEPANHTATCGPFRSPISPSPLSVFGQFLVSFSLNTALNDF